MKFVEMTGQALAQLVRDEEFLEPDLRKAGVRDDSIIRVNEQGDIELRKPDGWDVIGGLLGDFRSRIRHQTGMEWV